MANQKIRVLYNLTDKTNSNRLFFTALNVHAAKHILVIPNEILLCEGANTKILNITPN